MNNKVISREVKALLDSMMLGTGRNIVLGLANMQKLLDRLGNPERRLPPVIHIAGTNGKGSTLAFLTAMLQAGGYRVHRYTSPHLQRFNERILLADVPIEDAVLLDYLQKIQAPAKECGTTFFETTTAVALQAFAEHPADVVLLETGLGGRLDATNIVERPLATVITPVSLDHQEYLGHTLAKIAFEKAGILKPGVPAVIAPQAWEAQAVIEVEAEKKSAPLFRFGKEWKLQENLHGWHYQGREPGLIFSELSLIGKHQSLNAGTALACMEIITPRLQVAPEALLQGLRQAHWPGRLQKLTTGKLVEMTGGKFDIWLDGGHNEAGAAVIADWLGRKSADGAVDVLCGQSRGRDAGKFLPSIAAYARHIYGITIPGEGFDSVSAEQLAEQARAAGISLQPVDSVASAVQALANSSSPPAILLICGSLYLAGHVLDANETDVTGDADDAAITRH